MTIQRVTRREFVAGLGSAAGGGAGAAAGDADRFLDHPVIELHRVPHAFVPPRLEGSGIYRGPKRCDRISFGRAGGAAIARFVPPLPARSIDRRIELLG